MKPHAHLLPYQEERIALERARREARQTHDQPCDCAFCMTPARSRELVAAALARNASTSEEVPF